ncbi:MAG: hypothetical protein ACYCV7_13565 [Acidimicrobiales bacterium]
MMVAVYPVPDVHTGDQVMVALELTPGTSFDPVGFHGFLVDQSDLGTKWIPRFVRIVPEMPLTASQKVQKHRLRAEGWETSDPAFWRPGREGTYELLTADQVADLAIQRVEHGVEHGVRTDAEVGTSLEAGVEVGLTSNHPSPDARMDT